MKKKTVPILLLVSVIAGFVIFCASHSSGSTMLIAAAGPSKTLDNLQTAYEGESNAHARYIAFAEKADKEGYGQIASLFRAAAKSEEVHAKKHGEAIKALKAGPKAVIKAPEVKSTKENLEAALKGETYESENMYPGFIKQAEADKDKKAMFSFIGAQKAEIAHSKFYKEALSNMAGWKNGKKEFIVCSNCGYTTTDLKLKKCPVCKYPRNKFFDVK